MPLTTDARSGAAGTPRAARRDPAARAHAFADRLLYGDWLEDERLDRLKLAMIRAIVEWAREPARA